MSVSNAGPAMRVAALYAVFGCAWILGSDRLVGWLTADPATASLLQTLKGWAFVLVSAGLVYGLVRRERRQWLAAREDLEEAEESLEEAEGLYERVLAGISDAVLVIHAPSRRIVDCNPAALEVFGYARDELVGASTAVVHVDREHFERFGAAGDPVLERGEPFRAEWVLRRKDGETFRTEQVVSLIDHEAGDEPEYAVSVIRDVSERVERERQLERSRELLERYAEHLTRAREQERADIAREIHDELGQSLTGLKMQLSQVRARLEGGEDVASSTLDPSLELIQSTVEQVRELSSSLRPAALDQLGLHEGLAWLAGKFGDRTGIDVSFEVEDAELALDDEASIHVYRVVQEALTNVARHAEADAARVVISGEEDDLVVRVLDDGVGLDPESARILHSHGLLGMQERAHILGGELELLNRQEGGAEVRLRFPRPEGKVA